MLLHNVSSLRMSWLYGCSLFNKTFPILANSLLALLCSARTFEFIGTKLLSLFLISSCFFVCCLDHVLKLAWARPAFCQVFWTSGTITSTTDSSWFLQMRTVFPLLCSAVTEHSSWLLHNFLLRGSYNLHVLGFFHKGNINVICCLNVQDIFRRGSKHCLVFLRIFKGNWILIDGVGGHNHQD